MASILDQFLRETSAEIQLWSLPNVKGEGPERWIGTRDERRIKQFIAKRDVQGRGTFFCVSTIEPRKRRKKEFARELAFLFADLDFKDIDLPPEEIERRVLGLPLPPTLVHHTGNGLHLFWVLDRPALGDELDHAEILLRRLANHLGGDLQVAHRVALLRVPGSHNSKRGEWKKVETIREGAERYSLDQMERWLDGAREPTIARRNRETNPFLRRAQEQGMRPPVDVFARLEAMRVGGEADSGVHQTQLSCTAALTRSGVSEDDAVRLILHHTMQLSGSEHWNWQHEERALRRMCRDFAEKLTAEAGRGR